MALKSGIKCKPSLSLKSGYLMTVNRKTREFIPTQESRGKIARALGYFVIKYDYLSVLNEVIDVKHSWNGT